MYLQVETGPTCEVSTILREAFAKGLQKTLPGYIIVPSLKGTLLKANEQYIILFSKVRCYDIIILQIPFVVGSSLHSTSGYWSQ